MGAFLGALAELGYGFAWRVLDAQFFGVPQRRKRVFVVGRAGGDWRRAAEVLFERTGGGGDPAAGREAGEEVAPSAGRSASGDGPICVTGCVTHTLRAEGADAGEDGTGRGTPIVATPVAFHLTQDPISGPISPALSLGNRQGCATIGVLSAGLVRRLTPRECERLQGFPDDYTAILSDSARYRALGNSMAVPVMRWIGERIDRIERRAHGRS